MDKKALFAFNGEGFGVKRGGIWGKKGRDLGLLRGGIWGKKGVSYFLTLSARQYWSGQDATTAGYQKQCTY